MRNMLACIVFFSLLGCFPVVEPFYYISLADQLDSGVVVTKWEKLSLSRLSKNGVFPVEYSQFNGSYEVRYSLPQRNSLPEIRATIIDPNNRIARIEFKNNGLAKSPQGFSCANYYPSPSNKMEFTFYWLSECSGQGYEKRISFDVINNDGENIDQLDIPFELVRDGVVVYLDAI